MSKKILSFIFVGFVLQFSVNAQLVVAAPGTETSIAAQTSIMANFCASGKVRQS